MTEEIECQIQREMFEQWYAETFMLNKDEFKKSGWFYTDRNVELMWWSWYNSYLRNFRKEK